MGRAEALRYIIKLQDSGCGYEQYMILLITHYWPVYESPGYKYVIPSGSDVRSSCLSLIHVYVHVYVHDVKKNCL
jgi:hypothetical protein